MSGPIRVVIADDSAFMRKKIKEILAGDPDIRVMAAARDGQEAVDYVKEYEPDVVTMDINMPIMDGITALPADLDAAVVVVQHMPESFTGQFAKRLNDACRIPFKEVEAGDLLQVGHGYLARGGRHLVFAKRVSGGAMARYSTQPADSLHIPSVDVMVDSAIQAFGSDVIGVLLTGMGDDGATAMVNVRRAGGQTIAEDESTCIVFGMPAQAIERGGADFVLPCHEIAEKIVSLVACLV